jgi:hypothetical protein
MFETQSPAVQQIYEKQGSKRGRRDSPAPKPALRKVRTIAKLRAGPISLIPRPP